MEDLGLLRQRREGPRSMTVSLKVWPGRVTTQRKQVPRISASWSPEGRATSCIWNPGPLDHRTPGRLSSAWSTHGSSHT